MSKRPRYRRDLRKYDTNKHAFFCFSPTAKQGLEDCSDDRVSHHTYNKRFDFWARAVQLKMELSKKLLAHVACVTSTLLSVRSFPGPRALPKICKLAADLPAGPNIVVLP